MKAVKSIYSLTMTALLVGCQEINQVNSWKLANGPIVLDSERLLDNVNPDVRVVYDFLKSSRTNQFSFQKEGTTYTITLKEPRYWIPSLELQVDEKETQSYIYYDRGLDGILNRMDRLNILEETSDLSLQVPERLKKPWTHDEEYHKHLETVTSYMGGLK